MCKGLAGTIESRCPAMSNQTRSVLYAWKRSMTTSTFSPARVSTRSADFVGTDYEQMKTDYVLHVVNRIPKIQSIFSHSPPQIQKIKIEKKQKQQQQKNKLSESRKHLSAYRVLQRNLVYVIGLSQRMADADLLKKPEFFGKFGKVLKIAVGMFSTLQLL
jgi:predicted peptidase